VVDLGRWFDGSYRIPAPSDQDRNHVEAMAAPDATLASVDHAREEEDE
jgi:hypothetical protein